jgi:hypothetical protein
MKQFSDADLFIELDNPLSRQSPMSFSNLLSHGPLTFGIESFLIFTYPTKKDHI